MRKKNVQNLHFITLTFMQFKLKPIILIQALLEPEERVCARKSLPTGTHTISKPSYLCGPIFVRHAKPNVFQFYKVTKSICSQKEFCVCPFFFIHNLVLRAINREQRTENMGRKFMLYAQL